MVDRRAFAMVVAAVGVLTGCGGLDHADFDSPTSAPDSSTIARGACQMHTGIAVAFTPRVWTHDFLGNTNEQKDNIGVRSSDPGVVHLAQTTNDGTKWVAWAVAPGTARVEITYNDETATAADVTVSDPSP